METLRVAVVGTGGVANHHVLSLKKEPAVEVTACCDLELDRAEAFAARHGIAGVYTDYRKLLESESLDAVSVATSDVAHAPVSIAALEAGLHVLCEKPMATSVEEAERMLAAAEASGRMHMIQFSYRGVAALQRARQLVDQGRLGRIRHVEASYLQSWLANTSWGDWREKTAFLWRMSRAHRGGTLADIGCHILDFVTYVAGEIDTLSCTLRTFDKGVPGNKVRQYTLDADDGFVAQASFANGALGVIHATRWAQGHKNCQRLWVWGDRGALAIDTDDATDHLRICLDDFHTHEALWNRIPAGVEACAPLVTFVRSIRSGQSAGPTFADGLRIQRYLAACVESSNTGRPVTLGGAPAGTP
jgi:predicted dehydrogenase